MFCRNITKHMLKICLRGNISKLYNKRTLMLKGKYNRNKLWLRRNISKPCLWVNIKNHYKGDLMLKEKWQRQLNVYLLHMNLPLTKGNLLPTETEGRTHFI